MALVLTEATWWSLTRKSERVSPIFWTPYRTKLHISNPFFEYRYHNPAVQKQGWLIGVVLCCVDRWNVLKSNHSLLIASIRVWEQKGRRGILTNPEAFLVIIVVFKKLWQKNPFRKEVIQKFNLITVRVANVLSRNIDFGTWWSTSNEDIRGFRTVFEIGMRYFPMKTGVCFKIRQQHTLAIKWLARNTGKVPLRRFIHSQSCFGQSRIYYYTQNHFIIRCDWRQISLFRYTKRTVRVSGTAAGSTS